MKHLKQFENKKEFEVGNYVQINYTIGKIVGRIIEIDGNDAILDTINGMRIVFSFINYLEIANNKQIEIFIMEKNAKKFNL